MDNLSLEFEIEDIFIFNPVLYFYMFSFFIFYSFVYVLKMDMWILLAEF